MSIEQGCPIQTCTQDLKEQCDERGAWIFTASGKRYFPTSPRPEDVDIQDIAHALSRINRYTGHTRVAVSVAQHSVLCARLAHAEIALEALMHDAAEAYIGDISRPVKQWLRERDTSWDLMEDLNARTIARKFGLRYPWPEEIAAIDNIALTAEVRQFHCSEFHELLEQRGLTAPPIGWLTPWNAARSKREFLTQWRMLRGAR